MADSAYSTHQRERSLLIENIRLVTHYDLIGISVVSAISLEPCIWLNTHAVKATQKTNLAGWSFTTAKKSFMNVLVFRKENTVKWISESRFLLLYLCLWIFHRKYFFVLFHLETEDVYNFPKCDWLLCACNPFCMWHSFKLLVHDFLSEYFFPNQQKYTCATPLLCVVAISD